MKLKIEKLIYGGYGLARTNDKVVFIKGGVPGDLVDADITEEKKSFDIGNIKELIKPSSYRITPECEYFGKCGGCQWQNIEYNYQLEAKEMILRESLARIAGIKDFSIEPIIASENEYHYRNRLTLHLSTKNRRHFIGFKEEKSHEVVPIEQCYISSEIISSIINKISKLLNNYKEHTLPVDKIYISDICLHRALSVLPARNISESEVNKLLYRLKEHLQDIDISIDNKQENIFEFEVQGLKLISSPSVFAQSNPYINDNLVKILMNWADLKKNANVLDLYCGFGNLSLHLARMAGRVTGIDNNIKAIRFAKKSAKLNSIKNCLFELWDVKKYLDKYEAREILDLIVLDPPRAGAKEIIKSIINLKPKKILYVSCNPATLARDLKELINGGYQLGKVQPLDMFPQTFHLESLAYLKQ